MPARSPRSRRSRMVAVVVLAAILQGCSPSTSAPKSSSSPNPNITQSLADTSVSGTSAIASPQSPAVLRNSTSPSPTTKDIATRIGGYFSDSFTANRFRNLRALLVTVHGRTAFERYYHSSAAAYVNTQSEGKTIVGTLIGIALAEGRLRSLDERLPELLPSYRAAMTQQDRAITLRQLLTMTAGMPRDEVFYPKVFNTDRDWVRQILSDGPDFTFGQGFSYSSAGSHLLSVILSEATGKSTLAYARSKLFAPLGIVTTPAAEPIAAKAGLPAYERAEFAWPTDPQGHHIGAGGIKLTARDMVKLGQLWLDNGKWRGHQLVPADWLAQAQRAQVSTDNAEPPGYGFQQWVTAVNGHPAFAALGFGGQVTEVVPDLGLVVVSLAASPVDPTAPLEPGTADTPDYLELINSVIVPAVG